MVKFLYLLVSLVLLCCLEEISNIRSYLTRSFIAVASRQVETPFYGGTGRERGRGFDSLAQVFEGTGIPFLRKYVVPAAERVGTDCWSFPCQKLQKLSVGEKFSRQLQRTLEDKH